MVIYIEEYFLLNIFINYSIIYATREIAGQKGHCLRTIITAVLGGFLSIGFLYIAAYVFLYKLLSAIIMLFLMDKFKDIKKFIKLLLIFILSTNLLAMISNFIINLSSSRIETTNVNANIISFGVSLVYMLSCKTVIFEIKKQKRLNNVLYDVKLLSNNQNYELKGYYDSGNTLYDSQNRPIVVVDCEYFKNLKLKSSEEMIVVKTINGSKVVSSYIIDNLTIITPKDKKTYGSITAIKSSSKFKNYKILLHNSML